MTETNTGRLVGSEAAHPQQTTKENPVPVIPIDPAVRTAIRLLDELTDEEFAAVRMPVKPYGITRDEYRRALADGSFDAAVFTQNVRFSRRLLAAI